MKKKASQSQQDLRAVALRYRQTEDTAPRVVAKGHGYIAEEILQLAAEYDIPITQDPDLLNLLLRLEIPDTIPVELYRAVAEILAYVYKVKQNVPVPG